MKNLTEKIIVSLYGKKKHGSSTLEIPARTHLLIVIFSFAATFFFSHLFSSLLLHKAVNDLQNVHILAGVPSAEMNADSIGTLRLISILPPDVKRKVKSWQTFDFVPFLVTSDTIGLNELITTVTFRNQAPDTAELSSLLAGNITVSYGIPRFTYRSASEILNTLGFVRPNLERINSGNIHEVVQYAFAATLINKFRAEVTADYSHARRLLQATADYIQWFILLFTIWALMLILLRSGWMRVQRNVITHGCLKRDLSRHESVWELSTVQKNDSLLSLYRQSFGIGLLPVRIIDKAIERTQEQRVPENIDDWVGQTADELEVNVQKGEYEIVNYLMFGIPNLGFLGTIVGIVASMASVTAIIESSVQLDQVQAFDRVGGALGLAFDTTAVSLFSVLCLSLLQALLKKQEAELFTMFRFRANIALKYFWNDFNQPLKH